MKLESRKNFRVSMAHVQGNEAIFLFAALGFKIWHYRPLIRALNRRGFTVVAYDYPAWLVSQPDLAVWRQVSHDIGQDIREKIVALQAKSCRRFGAYGVSMGTLFANKAAVDHPEITHLVLNLTYGDVAANIWDSPLTRRTRRHFLKQGMDEAAVQKAVQYFDPVQNAPKLKGKKVLLYLAKRDKVLRYKISSKTREALEKAGVDVEYVEHRFLGHMLAGTKNLFALQKITDFFRS